MGSSLTAEPLASKGNLNFLKELKSKNVFIDTSIYVKENFQFSSEKFEALKKYALEDKIKLFIHNIIVEEIKSNIVEEIGKSISSIKKTKKEAKLFGICQKRRYLLFSINKTRFIIKIYFSNNLMILLVLLSTILFHLNIMLI